MVGNSLMKGKKAWNKGILRTEEEKAKQSKTLKGRKLSDNWKTKIAEAMRGKKFTQEHKKKMSDSAKRREERKRNGN